MLYFLFEYLEAKYQLPGAGLFQYLSFRSALAFIIIATIIPVLVVSNFTNIYISILLFTTIWLGFIGFTDDYIKIFKKNKDGLKGKFKIIGQIILGLVVGLTLYFHPDVKIKDSGGNILENKVYKSTKTTVPFLKNNELNENEFTGVIKNSSCKRTVNSNIHISIFRNNGVFLKPSMLQL